MVMTGVWHKSIFPGQPTALDLEGNRYGEEFYRRFRQCSPQEVTEKEIRDITDPLLRLVHVAASIGKTTLVSELIGEAVRHMGTAIADLGGLQKGEPSSFGNVRVGNLRENPALAAAIDFVDDGSLSDDQVIPLNEKGQAHPSPMLQIANPKIVLLESLKRELEESEKGEGKVKSPPACRLRK
ncbi:MAG: hypothetical protein QOE70_6313 [Chthoniobacter sp.]|jgi:hypothetical protein|nr:hypothetical protein [Chthoniobacter sp.]